MFYPCVASAALSHLSFGQFYMQIVPFKQKFFNVSKLNQAKKSYLFIIYLFI